MGVLGAILLLPLVYSIAAAVFAGERPSGELFLERPDPEHTRCVRDVEYMRYHHWELLRSLREEAVRYGQRGETNLIRCGECHTSRERFCNRCHDSVSLHPDCFECHYYP